jgi:hypothetical protein
LETKDIMNARDSFDRLLDEEPLVALGSDEDDEPTLRFHYEEALEEDATLETVYRGQIRTTSGVPLSDPLSQQRTSALDEFFRARPKRDLGIQLVARTTRSDRPSGCEPEEDVGEASDDRAA